MPSLPVRSSFVLILLGVALLTIAIVVRSGMLARKDPGEPINSAMRYALSQEAPQLSTEDSLFIDKHFSTASLRKSGLRFITHYPGHGDQVAKEGDTLAVNYVGKLLNGTVFDSTSAHGAPFEFRVGEGQVIKGWDEAFLGMKRGERRTLILPYWLAYGAAGSPPTIPPKATLIFEVELLEIKR